MKWVQHLHKLVPISSRLLTIATDILRPKISDKMKFDYNTLYCASSAPVGSILPTFCLLEPINIDVVLEDDDLDLLGHDTHVQITGTIHVDRYETIVRHGTPEFSACPIHTDKFLDISKCFVLHAKRNLISIDLASLGAEVSQLPSSLSIMGHSSRDEDSLISFTEPPILKMSVKYMLKVASKSQHERKRELQQEIHVLGSSLSEREGHLETAMRWPEGGYTETVSFPRPTRMFSLLKAPRSNQLMQRTLVIKVLSYEPFIVRQHSESATTRIVLGLAFNDLDPDEDSPPCLKLCADWALQPTTEILNASAALQREYTLIQLNDQGILNGKGQKITTPVWQRAKSEFASCATWTAAELELCIATPAAATTTGTLARHFLSPTFFTETLQHTYNLRLRVCCQLPGRVFGHATKSVDFNLPITVIYQAPGYNSDQSPPDYSA